MNSENDSKKAHVSDEDQYDREDDFADAGFEATYEDYEWHIKK